MLFLKADNIRIHIIAESRIRGYPYMYPYPYPYPWETSHTEYMNAHVYV